MDKKLGTTITKETLVSDSGIEISLIIEYLEPLHTLKK